MGEIGHSVNEASWLRFGEQLAASRWWFGRSAKFHTLPGEAKEYLDRVRGTNRNT